MQQPSNTLSGLHIGNDLRRGQCFMRVRGPKIRFYDSRGGTKLGFVKVRWGEDLCAYCRWCVWDFNLNFCLKFKGSRSLSGEGMASFLPPLSEALLYKMLISMLQCDLKWLSYNYWKPAKFALASTVYIAWMFGGGKLWCIPVCLISLCHETMLEYG